MPILKQEVDFYPEVLFETMDEYENAWLFYILSRREKDFMRKLISKDIAFYGPIIEKRYRSPGGRFRTSFIPLFSNYVFVFGSEEQRFEAMTTNCVSKYTQVTEKEQLIHDLTQIRTVLHSGVPVLQEQKMEKGQDVHVKNGPFKGFDGKVIRRESKTRLLVHVKFIDQGVSMEIDEAQLQAV
jgi:transcription antitermination factor NusG